MFTKALVAIELSDIEKPMLDCLREMSAIGVNELVLVHVIRVGYIEGAEYGKEDECAARLEQTAKPLREAGFEVTVDVRDAADVAGTILTAAAEHHADSIVVGSRGHNMTEKIFLGSVAREVLRKSLLPVWLDWLEPTAESTRARCERVCRGGLKRLLLATDFSDDAGPAESVAVDLAATADSVDLVHVLDESAMGNYSRWWPVMARAAADTIGRDIGAAGSRIETHLPEGKPSAEIARLGSAREVNLIIVGKHGQNQVREMVIGSTAAALCEIARRPVLMVPQPHHVT